MTIKELFDRNGNLYIRGSYYGIYRNFLNYEDYILYLHNLFYDEVVNQILNSKFEKYSSNVYTAGINSELKRHSKNSYSLDVVVETEIPKICIYEGFWWDVEK